MRIIKPIETLGEDDFSISRVWRYANRDERGDTLVAPVRRLPADHLRGRIAIANVRLANGRLLWAILGNLDPVDAAQNEQFRTLSILHHGKWLHLPRYYDPDWSTSGPSTFAERLGLTIADVFPISYDVRQLVRGAPQGLVGVIHAEPRIRLTRAQRIALAVE